MLRYLHLALVVCCSLCISVDSLRAQTIEPLTDPDDVSTDPFADDVLTPDDTPTLPDVVVEGRPFPTDPIGDDTVVTPTRSSSRLSQTASSVTVITSEQLEAAGYSTVVEALHGVPGVDIAQRGGLGKQASVFLRGANSAHTKVLLDGMPLNDPSNANRAFDFSALSTDNIQQIEIVRGPQSLLYGSDALGGVINIITKRGEGPPSGSVSGMGGSFGTHEERVNISGGDVRHYYSFGASYLDTDGITAVSSRFGATESDGYEAANFSGRYGWTPCDLLNVDYVFRYTDADTEVDGFVGFAPGDVLLRENRLKSFTNRVQLQSLLLDGLVEQTVGFSLTDYDRFDTGPGAFTPQFNGQSRVVDWQTNFVLTNSNTLSAGIDYMQEEVSTSAVTLQKRHLGGVFLQDQFEVGDCSYTTVGVRWDDHSTAGQAQTYRFTQLFRIDHTGTSFHGTIGRGFKAPAIAQIAPGFFGANLALQPESAKGWDAGFEQQFLGGNLVVDATYFNNKFTNLITFAGGLNRNVARAHTSGVEVIADWRITDVCSLTGGYTYTDAEDLSAAAPPGGRLFLRPRHKASFSIHRRWHDRASTNLYFLYVGKRFDFGNVPLAEFITVNMSGTYELSERCELFGRVENLTDSDYEEAAGFATPGISGYAGVRTSW